jgi:hypothetical protein
MPSVVTIAGIYSGRWLEGPGPGAEDEYVVLVNTGDEPAEMQGWSLTNLKCDQLDHYRYMFPRFLSNGDAWALAPGGMILLYTGRGTNGCTATAGEARQFRFFQHRLAWIWEEPGDTACLYDRDRQLVTTWALPEVRRKV